MKKIDSTQFDQVSGGAAFVLSQIDGPTQATVTYAGGSQTFYGSSPYTGPAGSIEGDACRATWSAVGAGLGGGLLIESGPGALVGGAIGGGAGTFLGSRICVQ